MDYLLLVLELVLVPSELQLCSDLGAGCYQVLNPSGPLAPHRPPRTP